MSDRIVEYDPEIAAAPLIKARDDVLKHALRDEYAAGLLRYLDREILGCFRRRRWPIPACPEK